MRPEITLPTHVEQTKQSAQQAVEIDIIALQRACEAAAPDVTNVELLPYINMLTTITLPNSESTLLEYLHQLGVFTVSSQPATIFFSSRSEYPMVQVGNTAFEMKPSTYGRGPLVREHITPQIEVPVPVVDRLANLLNSFIHLQKVMDGPRIQVPRTNKSESIANQEKIRYDANWYKALKKLQVLTIIQQQEKNTQFDTYNNYVHTPDELLERGLIAFYVQFNRRDWAAFMKASYGILSTDFLLEKTTLSELCQIEREFIFSTMYQLGDGLWESSREDFIKTCQDCTHFFIFRPSYQELQLLLDTQ